MQAQRINANDKRPLLRSDLSNRQPDAAPSKLRTKPTSLAINKNIRGIAPIFAPMSTNKLRPKPSASAV